MTAAALTLGLQPSRAYRGAVQVPGDKSISHRAAMLAALASGTSFVSHFLAGADNLATVNAMRALGVQIEQPEAQRLIVHGVGMAGLRQASQTLDLGNAGTAIRLLAGLLCGQPFASVLSGDASLCRRPMARIIEPLTAMGARIHGSASHTPPLHIAPASGGLHGIRYQTPVASAQLKSSLLLAGLYARGTTTVVERERTRDHSERLLQAMGAVIEGDGRAVAIQPVAQLQPVVLDVPGDFSSAAFHIVGASIAAEGEVLLQRVGINPLRTGLLDLLREMGARVELLEAGEVCGEPVADLLVRPAVLRGIDIGGEVVGRAIDEFPALFIAAACAEGPTRVRDAAELRVKESDRIAVMARMLAQVGCVVSEQADGLTIEPRALRGHVSLDSAGDHRCAMAASLLALRVAEPFEVRDCANIATSYPSYAADAAGLGLRLHEV